MVQQEPNSRFSHKLSQLQQARLQGEITGNEYEDQLSTLIEAETHSDEESNQNQRRAFLWAQAEAAWKHLEAEKAAQGQREHEQQAKDQEEEERRVAMQSQQAEADKLRPFIRYVQKTMNEDLPQMRKKSRSSRSWYNFLEGIVIMASAVAAAIVNIGDLPRWYTSIVTIIVAVASGFIVARKLKERSTTLQQTGDLIDAEYEAFHLKLDEYDTPDVEVRYKLLTRRLKRLKEEQRNRELLLEQSPETAKQASPAVQA